MISSTDDPRSLLTRHLECFVAYDLEGTMADYAHDAVVINPFGELNGSESIREFYADLFHEFDQPATTFELLKSHVHGDVAYIVWTAETTSNHFEIGSDTFIVRDGRIVTQTFAGKISPKS